MSPDLHVKLAKACRVRGPGVRSLYVNARRAGRFFRDAPRRAALGALPLTDIEIPHSSGFLLVSPGRFEQTAGIVADAREALRTFDESRPPDGKNRKRFLQNVLDPSTLRVDSAIVRFALSDEVLASVCRYLGVVPFLTAINVFHSDTVDGNPTSSQLYHCDGDDVTQIKIFVYCSDVDMRSGPLTVLDAASTQAVQRQTGYQYRQRLSDEQVHTVVGRSGEHPILGPSGTTAFVDTSRCFHFGSRVAPDAPPRLVTMVQYQTPYSFMLPAAAQAALPFRRFLSPSLTSLQRLVLGE